MAGNWQGSAEDDNECVALGARIMRQEKRDSYESQRALSSKRPT